MIKKTIKGTSIELTPAIESAIDKALAAIEKYVDPEDTSVLVDVEVGKTTNHHKSGDIFRAEFNFHSRIADLRAESEKEDLYAAILEVRDELVEALRSKKEKKMDFVRRSGLKLKNMLKGLPWKRDTE